MTTRHPAGQTRHGPRAIKLGLTQEQLAKRRYSLGGSDANILMNGDPHSINALWEQKRGGASDDLSRVLPVQLGAFTEEFNRYWYELTTGRLVYCEGEERTHPDIPWMTCNLDGATTTAAGEPAIWEGKHVGGFEKTADVVQRYMPQLFHNMAVCGVERAILSILIGNGGYEPFEVANDFVYAAQLLDREKEFWACVTEGRRPHDMPNVAVPVNPDAYRTVDMTGSNAWASHAADWLETQAAAKRFETARKDIGALVERDVGIATGHGILAKRDKRGAISISVHKPTKEAA